MKEKTEPEKINRRRVMKYLKIEVTKTQALLRKKKRKYVKRYMMMERKRRRRMQIID